MSLENNESSQNETKLVGGVSGKGWLPGQSGNPGGRPSGKKVAQRLADALGPMLKGYKYNGLVARGRQLRPDELWLAISARYEMAILDPGTSLRDLTAMGRQLGELAGVLGINVNHLHQHQFAPETLAFLDDLVERKAKWLARAITADPPSLTPSALPVLTDVTEGSLTPAIAIPSPDTAE